jgi:hypothetical protein
MLENNDVHEVKEGKRLIVFNLCCMAHKHQTRFLQMMYTAQKNGINCVKFVKTWNRYAQDISEHVFWHINEPQEKFKER